MIQVLFVCLGNICRSPMAEAVMRELVRKECLDDKIAVDSAATSSWHIDEPPHRGTQEKLGNPTSPKIFRFLDLTEHHKDVPDPHYTGDFQETYDLVLEGCTALLEKIKVERL